MSQAQHQWSKGDADKAVKHIEDFLNHIKCHHLPSSCLIFQAGR
ncbi:FIMAH domain-containing protein [Paenibacillus aestuarii]|uniref:FIMAH domain-containing protein n=1 Tax=Paenibacillus aestuarii TaxID=516965 RepID=A0ABW0KJN2_9BACL